MITSAWEEQQAIKEVMVFLQGVGVSTSLAVRIYKTYRDQAIDVVRRQPYRLAADIWGIGFKTADTIAQRLGIPHDSPERVKAGLQFALSEASEDGHCYLPEGELIERATGLLGVEAALAAGLLRLLGAPGDRLATFQKADWTAALNWLGQSTRLTLSPEQEAAVRLALTERVAVLTGGPGCGKSYTVR